MIKINTNLKNILKFFLKIILFFTIILVGLAVMIEVGVNVLGLNSDYCIEDGDCKAGEEIFINKNEKITISKETCLKYGWQWSEKRNMCKVKYETIR